MLKLKEFTARNAGCFESLKLNLDNQGLVFASGENHDEPRRADGSYEINGTGKTTLFELLTHVCYQTTSKGGSKNRVVNLYNPKNFALTLDFEKDDIPYRIEQYRNHKEYKTCLRLIENGTPIHAEGTQAIKQTQQRIEARLGLSLGEWFGFVYLAQNSTHAMVSGTPAEKKRYLARVFGVDVIDAYDKNLAVFLTEQKDSARRLAEASERIEVLELEAEKTPCPSSDDFQALRDRRNELQGRLDDVSKRNAMQGTLLKRDAYVPALLKLGLSDLRTLKGANQWVKDAIPQFQEDVAKAEADLALVEKHSTLRAKLPKDSKRPDVSALEKALRKLRVSLDEAKEQRTQYEQWKKLQAERKEISDLDSETLASFDGTKNYRARIAAADGQRAILRKEIAALKGIEGEATCERCLQSIDPKHNHAQCEEKERALAKVEAERTALLAKDAKYVALHSEAKLYASWKSRVKGMKEVERPSSTRIAELGEEVSAAEKELERARRVATLWEELDALPPLPTKTHTPEAIELSRKQIALLQEVKVFDWHLPSPGKEDLEKQQRKLHRKLSKAQAALTTAKHQRDQAQQRDDELAELRKTVKGLAKETHRTEVAEVLRVSLQDVKHARLKEATRILTTVLPGYVQAFFPSKRVNVHIDESKEDKLDLLFEKGGKIIPLADLSGGQAKRLSIAIVLSFTKLTAQTVNILIADEPYGSLDSISRGTCFELLRDVGVPTTILTGHDSDVSKQRYDQRWTCVMKNDVSTLYRR